MKKDLKAKVINREIKKPNAFLMFITMRLLGVLNKIYKVKFKYDYNHKDIKKGPTILLASHASRLEFIYMIYGFRYSDINIVCGYQNIIKKGLYKICLKLGVISKYLYQPDIMCTKNILKVLKRNGRVAIFPEGIQSTSGSLHPINPATAQLIKRSNANVVVATSKGAYLATNRYSKSRKKGPIEINFSLAFTKESLNNLNEEEIYKILKEKIYYNDFEYNKIARNKYIGKESNAKGIDKILYKCPDCKKEHTLYVENDTIICKNCNIKIKVNEYYDLISERNIKLPEDIDKWYKWQRRCVKEEILSDDFELSMDATLCTLKLDKIRKESKNKEVLTIGKITLNNKGLFINDFEFNAKQVYSLTLSTKGYLEFYANNDYYMIIPKNKNENLIKWTLASEEIHNLYDEKWHNACTDVYEYDKGDIYE